MIDWEGRIISSKPHRQQILLADLDDDDALVASLQLDPSLSKAIDQNFDKEFVLGLPLTDQPHACRRYLQAITLADISNDQGTKVEPSMITGEFEASPQTHRTELFNQKKPQPAAWRVWKKFLSTITHQHYSFPQPLRNWIVDFLKCRRYPSYVYHESTNDLYKKNDGQWYTKMTPISPGRFKIPEDPTPPTSDPAGYPVYVQDNGHILVLWRNYTTPALSDQIIMHQTFRNYITALPPWESSLLENHTLRFDPAYIMQELNKGTIAIASDGTVIHQSAAFGYVIASTETKQRLVTGRGPAFGTDPTSFRAEAYGALAALQMLYQLSNYTQIAIQTPIQHYIDNSGVVNRIKKASAPHRLCNPNATLAPDWDVIQQFHHSRNSIPTSIDVQWIQGHQDEHRPRSSLPFEAQLNCEADDEGAAFQETNMEARWAIPTFPSTQAHLIIVRQTITSKYKTVIRESLNLPPLMKYLQQRFHWDEDTISNIDWVVFQQLMKHQRQHHRIMVKHTNAIAPTGRIAHRNQPHLSRSCPSCACSDETNDHVIVCPALSRARWPPTLCPNWLAISTRPGKPIQCSKQFFVTAWAEFTNLPHQS